jgi:hypothetical protein
VERLLSESAKAMTHEVSGGTTMDEKVDWTFLVVSFGIFMAAIVLKRPLFHGAPGYVPGAIAVGLIVAFAIYRCFTFRE